MKKPELNPSRRSLLKSLAATGTIATTGYHLPERWARPVVNAIVLPVHASSSPAMGTYQDIVALDVVTGSVDGANLLRDLLIPAAHASASGTADAGGTGDCELEICIVVENEVATLNISSPYGYGSDIAFLPFDISITLSDVIVPCAVSVTGMYDPDENAIVGQVYFCCSGDVVGYTAKPGVGSCSSPAAKTCVVTKSLAACKKAAAKKITMRQRYGTKKKRLIAANERRSPRLKTSRKV